MSDSRFAERERIAAARGLSTLEEIGVLDGLDEECAVEHFLGVSPEEAEALFADNFLYYGEDLMWMGPTAFCYYVDAAIAYLMSPAADGDCDAVNGFHINVAFRVEHDRGEITGAFPKLRAACDYLLANFHRYDVDPEIYGDLPGALSALRADIA